MDTSNGNKLWLLNVMAAILFGLVSFIGYNIDQRLSRVEAQTVKLIEAVARLESYASKLH
jgi:hypothetical protein